MPGPPSFVVTVHAPAGREYLATLQQTKLVYDEMLSSKLMKLTNELMAIKAELDSRCESISKESPDHAMEFGVRAQEAVNSIDKQNYAKVRYLQADYQSKLDKMAVTLEEKWQQNKQNTTNLGKKTGKK